MIALVNVVIPWQLCLSIATLLLLVVYNALLSFAARHWLVLIKAVTLLITQLFYSKLAPQRYSSHKVITA